MPRLTHLVVALGLSLSACSRQPRSARRPARLAAALPLITHVVAPPSDPPPAPIPCSEPAHDIIEICSPGTYCVAQGNYLVVCDPTTGRWVHVCACVAEREFGQTD